MNNLIAVSDPDIVLIGNQWWMIFATGPVPPRAIQPITVVPLNGLTGTVTFSVSRIPAGVNYTFKDPSSTAATTFVIYVPTGVAASSNNKLVITGTSGSTTAQKTVTLNIP